MISTVTPPEICIKSSTPELVPATRALIDERVKGCAGCRRSAVLIALRELLNSDRRYTHQISEIIRRDPSLTARLLRW